MSDIRTADVCKVFGRGGTEVVALRDVTFEVARGERIALLGKSGSGKSTLLNLLGGLDRPTSGQIHIGERDLSSFSTSELARHRRETVGMVFQSFHLVPSRSARENVELPMIFAGITPRERRRRAVEMLEAVGLGSRISHRPAELSGGERQRVALARALVNRPSIVLADEPTGNLDSITAGEVIDHLRQHLDRHQMTLVLVTHDEELAATLAHRVLRLQDGRLV